MSVIQKIYNAAIRLGLNQCVFVEGNETDDQGRKHRVIHVYVRSESDKKDLLTAAPWIHADSSVHVVVGRLKVPSHPEISKKAREGLPSA